jgi:aryl-alcohol dehydrogenase-like predicted oxidoreductase
VAFVAFSPVGRGFLTDTLPDIHALDTKDIRRALPRFLPGQWPANVALHGKIAALAREHGVTMAQLSLAWVLSRGEHVLAIPGTTSLAHLHENLATPLLPAAVLDALSALTPPGAAAGERYAAQGLREVDTEVF